MQFIRACRFVSLFLLTILGLSGSLYADFDFQNKIEEIEAQIQSLEEELRPPSAVDVIKSLAELEQAHLSTDDPFTHDFDTETQAIERLHRRLQSVKGIGYWYMHHVIDLRFETYLMDQATRYGMEEIDLVEAIGLGRAALARLRQEPHLYSRGVKTAVNSLVNKVEFEIHLYPWVRSHSVWGEGRQKIKHQGEAVIIFPASEAHPKEVRFSAQLILDSMTSLYRVIEGDPLFQKDFEQVVRMLIVLEDLLMIHYPKETLEVLEYLEGMKRDDRLSLLTGKARRILIERGIAGKTSFTTPQLYALSTLLWEQGSRDSAFVDRFLVSPYIEKKCAQCFVALNKRRVFRSPKDHSAVHPECRPDASYVPSFCIPVALASPEGLGAFLIQPETPPLSILRMGYLLRSLGEPALLSENKIKLQEALGNTVAKTVQELGALVVEPTITPQQWSLSSAWVMAEDPDTKLQTLHPGLAYLKRRHPQFSGETGVLLEDFLLELACVSLSTGLWEEDMSDIDYVFERFENGEPQVRDRAIFHLARISQYSFSETSQRRFLGAAQALVGESRLYSKQKGAQILNALGIQATEVGLQEAIFTQTLPLLDDLDLLVRESAQRSFIGLSMNATTPDLLEKLLACFTHRGRIRALAQALPYLSRKIDMESSAVEDVLKHADLLRRSHDPQKVFHALSAGEALAKRAQPTQVVPILNIITPDRKDAFRYCDHDDIQIIFRVMIKLAELSENEGSAWEILNRWERFSRTRKAREIDTFKMDENHLLIALSKKVQTDPLRQRLFQKLTPYMGRFKGFTFGLYEATVSAMAVFGIQTDSDSLRMEIIEVVGPEINLMPRTVIPLLASSYHRPGFYVRSCHFLGMSLQTDLISWLFPMGTSHYSKDERDRIMGLIKEGMEKSEDPYVDLTSLRLLDYLNSWLENSSEEQKRDIALLAFSRIDHPRHPLSGPLAAKIIECVNRYIELESTRESIAVALSQTLKAETALQGTTPVYLSQAIRQLSLRAETPALQRRLVDLVTQFFSLYDLFHPLLHYERVTKNLEEAGRTLGIRKRESIELRDVSIDIETRRARGEDVGLGRSLGKNRRTPKRTR